MDKDYQPRTGGYMITDGAGRYLAKAEMKGAYRKYTLVTDPWYAGIWYDRNDAQEIADRFGYQLKEVTGNE